MDAKNAEKSELPVAGSTEMTEAEKYKFFGEIKRIEEERKNESSKPSPYRIHQDKIFGCYGTAYRLQDLILHLYHSRNKCDLGNLLANADVVHSALTIDIIRRYSILGENDQDFMETARQIQKRRKRR